MLFFNESELAQWTDGTWTTPLATPVRGFCNDTRTLNKGDLFVAFRTENRDGHNFLFEAKQSGAAAALVEVVQEGIDLPQLQVKNVLKALQIIAKNHRLKFDGIVIGVTGSCGKTSSKDLLASLLGEEISLKTEKNLNNEIGVALTLLKLDSKVHQYGIVEAGISKAGEMDSLSKTIQADLVLITNIGSSHLENLENIEGVAREKSLLITNSKLKCRAYLNENTHGFSSIQKGISSAQAKVSILSDSKLDTKKTTNYKRSYIAQTETAEQRVRLIMQSHSFSVNFVIPEMTSGMIQNFIQVIKISLDLGIEKNNIQKRLNSWKPSYHRGEWVSLKNQEVYIDCYNANPLSMLDAVHYFDQKTLGKDRLFLLGKMEELGEDSNPFHLELLGSLNLRSKDSVKLVGHFDYEFQEKANAIMGPSFCIYPEVQKAAETFDNWKGVVFLKGSRNAQLEKLLS